MKNRTREFRNRGISANDLALLKKAAIKETEKRVSELKKELKPDIDMCWMNVIMERFNLTVNEAYDALEEANELFNALESGAVDRSDLKSVVVQNGLEIKKNRIIKPEKEG